jgi:methionyl-tRNA formyltransferase
LPDDAVELLSSVDIAIQLGFGVIKANALTAPEFGMLSFHHGDIRKYRGRPAGFWEYMNGEPTAGVTLQRLSESLDGAETVDFTQVDISNASSWLEVRRCLYSASEPTLANGIK